MEAAAQRRQLLQHLKRRPLRVFNEQSRGASRTFFKDSLERRVTLRSELVEAHPVDHAAPVRERGSKLFEQSRLSDARVAADERDGALPSPGGLAPGDQASKLVATSYEDAARICEGCH
jgi:hypothetical protein